MFPVSSTLNAHLKAPLGIFIFLHVLELTAQRKIARGSSFDRSRKGRTRISTALISNSEIKNRKRNGVNAQIAVYVHF